MEVEYDEEVIQEREVEEEVVQEIRMPQVKALYRYKGQGMGIEKGEVCLCVCTHVCICMSEYVCMCTYVQVCICNYCRVNTYHLTHTGLI